MIETARELMAGGRMEKALAMIKKGMKEEREKGEWTTLFGKWLFLVGHHKKALNTLEGIKISREVSLLRAKCLMDLGKFREVDVIFDDLRKSDDSFQREYTFELMVWSTLLERHRCNIKPAQNYLKKAEMLCDESLPSEVSLVRFHKGALKVQEGFLEEGLGLLMDALEAALGNDLPRTRALILYQIGSTLRRMGLLYDAKERLLAAVSDAERVSWLYMLASIHMEMGLVLEGLGKFDEGLREYSLAENLYIECGHDEKVSYVRFNMSALQIYCGQLKEAEESLTKILKDDIQSDEIHSVSMDRALLAMLYTNWEDYPKAISEAKEGLKILAGIENAETESQLLIYLCECLLNSGDIGKAEKYLERLGNITYLSEDIGIKAKHLILSGRLSLEKGEEAGVLDASSRLKDMLYKGLPPLIDAEARVFSFKASGRESGLDNLLIGLKILEESGALLILGKCLRSLGKVSDVSGMEGDIETIIRLYKSLQMKKAASELTTLFGKICKEKASEEIFIECLSKISSCDESWNVIIENAGRALGGEARLFLYEEGSYRDLLSGNKISVANDQKRNGIIFEEIEGRKICLTLPEEEHTKKRCVENILRIQIQTKPLPELKDKNGLFINPIPDLITTRSQSMEEPIKKIIKAARFRYPVLLTGENGTGKDVFARSLLSLSQKPDVPFFSINCANLTSSLAHSQLFGHKKGSFTGADRDHIGLVESARGGFLFLDEIGELPPETQAQMLRFLQNYEFVPLGDVKNKKADVRIVAATNRPIQEAITEGRFRQDLYHRLSVIHITIPALRERLPDIPLLTEIFLNRCADENQAPVPVISKGVYEAMMNYSWPGNVRELENIVKSLFVEASEEKAIRIDHLPVSFLKRRSDTGGRQSLRDRLAREERGIIQEAMRKTKSNKTKAARLLGISRPALFDRMKRLGIEKTEE